MEIEGETYYEMDTDVFIAVPISKKEFQDSLYFNSINFIVEENSVTMELFVDTNPDYFAGHSMNVDVLEEEKIVDRGLAG